jgi:hypothetical protein
MLNGYYVHRKKEDLYCTPYLAEGDASASDSVVVHASSQMDEHHRDQMSIAMYNDIDYSVDHWIMDKRYVPRLLVSALGFLACYFFCSLVVRDPIPMVDELVVSAVAFVLLWHFFARRDVACATAQNLRANLKEQASKAMVQVDGFLFKVEQFLSECEALGYQDLAETICKGTLPDLSDVPSDFTSSLHAYLLVHAKPTELWYEELTAKKKHPELLSLRLSDAILSGKVDGSLLALMVRLGKN